MEFSITTTELKERRQEVIDFFKNNNGVERELKNFMWIILDEVKTEFYKDFRHVNSLEELMSDCWQPAFNGIVQKQNTLRELMGKIEELDGNQLKNWNPVLKEYI